MIEILLIVITVMFGTLLYDKRKREKFVIRGRNPTERSTFGVDRRQSRTTCDQRENPTEGGSRVIKENFELQNTPSYSNFLSTTQVKNNINQDNFSPYTYQPIDYDNNIASIYGYKSDGYDTTPKSTVLTCTENDGLMGMNRWCGCEPLSTNGTTETATRRLIGGVNSKTLIAPKIIPPITDMEEWGTDNYTHHSATNSHRSDDLFLSGYVTLDNCKCIGTCNKPLLKETFNYDHNYLNPYDVSEQRLTRSQILQNYGISKIPEKPVYASITNGDDLMFIERQKNNSKRWSLDYITGDEPSMIYDPRMVGYSDSNRSYVDKILGQPKFYYDDINSARAPNYITRNKIDIYSFGETTGRLKDPKNSQTCGDNNQLAVEEFHNSALLHRADMMQSLMNKRNGEMWQLRNFPISTNGQRMLGGTSKI